MRIEFAPIAESQSILEGDGFSLDIAYVEVLFREFGRMEPQTSLRELQSSHLKPLSRDAPFLSDELLGAASACLGRAIRYANITKGEVQSVL